MAIYAHIHKSVIRPLWDKYNNINYAQYYAAIAGISNASIKDIRQYQLAKLKKLLRHAEKNVPYYQELFRKAGIAVARINTWQDFKTIPLLEKAELRNNPQKFIDVQADVSQLIRSGTGGTTDSPIPIFYDRNRRNAKVAEMVFFRKWFSWHPESKVTYLWGAPGDFPKNDSLLAQIRNKYIDRCQFLPASLLNEQIMASYVDRINKFKPEIIQAYSNPAYLLARYILTHNKAVHRPKTLVVTAEPCYRPQRQTIKQAFDCPVTSFYGAREAGYIACECSQQQLHINSHGLFVEILKQRESARPHEIGDVVITDLLNFTMPLIRYKIGDMASIAAHPCDCGCELPRLNFFAGRETDVFVTPQGDLIPGVSLCDRVVKDCAGFAQLQFVQDRPDTLTVKMVKGGNFTQIDMRILDEAIAQYFQGKLKIEKIFVAEIPKEKSGKTRFCISKLPDSPKV